MIAEETIEGDEFEKFFIDIKVKKEIPAQTKETKKEAKETKEKPKKE